MKIVAYEVRADEREEMRKEAERHQVELVQVAEPLSEENIEIAAGADGITILGTCVDADMMKQLSARNVKVLATRTIGYDHIDIKAAKDNGIHVCNGYYDPDGVAEYTIMLMLMSLRNYKQALYRANAKDYSLSGLMGKEMRNLTIGIVGTGKIGMKVIEMLQGFGCEILAYNRHEREHDGLKFRYCSLEELYEKSDLISLHVPLATQTRYMIHEESIAKMKKGVVLINCARGELMCLKDVIKGIESEKIGALGLDVIEDEEGIYHRDRRSDIIANQNMAYIRQFPNVTMTQHMAFYTKEAVKSMATGGVCNIVRCMKKEDNPNMIC